MDDFLRFKTMVTPFIIWVLFWVGVIACVIAGIVNIVSGNFFNGVLLLIVGPFLARVYCEIMIVIFSINDTLTEIKNKARGTIA